MLRLDDDRGIVVAEADLPQPQSGNLGPAWPHDGEVDHVAVRTEGFGQTLHLVAVGVGKSDVEPDPSWSRDLRTLLK